MPNADTSPTPSPHAYTVADRERLEILKKYHTIAMVGLSPNPYRPSYFAAIYLQRAGYRIIPVNPAAAEILGERSYPDVLSIPEPVDVVDVFRRVEEVPAIADQAIAKGAKVLWLQFGIVHEEAAAKARAAGLQVVMDRCMKVEHARFFGNLNLVGLNSGVISAKRRFP
ncbi:MAG: CoA-binding protein [Chloroflexi bacterium]|nr:CoA-binding protein [Chloroflexota bacterium]